MWIRFEMHIAVPSWIICQTLHEIEKSSSLFSDTQFSISLCVCVCACASGWFLLFAVVGTVYHFKPQKNPDPCTRHTNGDEFRRWRDERLRGGMSASGCHKSLSSLLPPSVCTAFSAPRTKCLPHNGDVGRKERPLGRETSGRVWREARWGRGGGGRKVNVGVEVTMKL